MIHSHHFQAPVAMQQLWRKHPRHSWRCKMSLEWVSEFPSELSSTCMGIITKRCFGWITYFRMLFAGDGSQSFWKACPTQGCQGKHWRWKGKGMALEYKPRIFHQWSPSATTSSSHCESEFSKDPSSKHMDQNCNFQCFPMLSPYCQRSTTFPNSRPFHFPCRASPASPHRARECGAKALERDAKPSPGTNVTELPNSFENLMRFKLKSYGVAWEWYI